MVLLVFYFYGYVVDDILKRNKKLLVYKNVNQMNI